MGFVSGRSSISSGGVSHRRELELPLRGSGLSNFQQLVHLQTDVGDFIYAYT